MSVLMSLADGSVGTLGVVPVMVGPLQALMAVLPGILAALGGLLLALFKPATVKRLFLLLWAQKVPVVIVVALVAAGVYFGDRLLPARAQVVTQASDDAADWTGFRGGLTRRGYVPSDHGDPVSGGVNWSHSGGDNVNFYSSPTVVGNRVYVASAQVSMFDRQGTGAVLCLDADTGGVVWRGGPSDYRATFSSPAVVGNRLAIGEGLHEARDARMMVLDLDRQGEVLWSYRGNSHAESSPTIHGDRVYFGAGRDGYYCFELEPDAEGNAQLVWHVPGERYPDASGSPTAYKDTVYVPMGRWGGHAVAALDADTGEERWRMEMPYPVFSGPTIAVEQNLLLVGMGTGNFIQTAEEALPGELERLRAKGATEEEVEAARARLGPAGEVWAIDLETREVRWRFEAQRTVLGQVAVDGERAYFGSRDGHLYCVSTKTGKLIGKWDARDAILASPAVAAEHVYVVTESGFLYALDKQRLMPVWDIALGHAPSLSSPTVARGRVYVGSTGNGLLSLGQPGGRQTVALWGGERGGPGRSGWAEGSLMPNRGSYAWSYREPLTAEGDGPAALSAAPAVRRAGGETAGDSAEATLFAPLTGTGGYGLARLDFPKGLGAAPQRKWLVESELPIHRSPALVGRTVYFVDGETGDPGRSLRAVDAEGGAERWRRPVAAEAPGTLAATRDHLVVADIADGLSGFAIAPGEEGDAPAPLWTARIGNVVGAPFIDGDLVIAATAAPAQLAVLDLGSGAVLWRQPLERTPRTGPVLVRDMVWLGQNDGAAGYDLFTGELRYTVNSATVVDRLVVRGDRVAWTTEAGEAYVIDGVSGDMAATLKQVAPVYAPLLGDAGLLYWSEERGGSLQWYDFETGEHRFWTRLTAAWPGVPQTPPVMVDRHLLFGTQARGVVCIKPEN